jgi:hypothetical protein
MKRVVSGFLCFLMLAAGGCAGPQVLAVRQSPIVSAARLPEMNEVACVVRAVELGPGGSGAPVVVYRRLEFQGHRDRRLYIMRNAVLPPGFSIGDEVIVTFTKEGYVWDVRKGA